MSRLPAVGAKNLIAALERAGFVVTHTKGSHVRLRLPSDPRRNTVVPHHPGDLPRPLLFRILKQARLTPEELRKYL
ncbi:MAG: type II toxin-antitoxin system HicA family toxin [Rhodospirillales bacterium]